MKKTLQQVKHENIVNVANWLMDTSSVYYDYALRDSEELLGRDPEDFKNILKQINKEDGHAIHWRDGTFLKQQ